MAPRRGGGSSHGSSSSSSNTSTRHIQLVGSYWTNPATDAQFALDCLLVLALIYCMIKAARSHWTRQNGALDKLRTTGYKYSCYFLFISYVLEIVGIIFSEIQASVQATFYIIYAVGMVTYLVSVVLLVAILFRTVEECYVEKTSTAPKKLRIVNYLVGGVFFVVAAVYAGLYCKLISEVIASDANNSTVWSNAGVNIAYAVFIVVIAVMVFTWSIIFFTKKVTPTHHRRNFLILATVFFLQSFISIICTIIAYAALWKSSSVNAIFNTNIVQACILPASKIVVYVVLIHLGEPSIMKGKTPVAKPLEAKVVDTSHDMDNANSTQYHSGYGKVPQSNPVEINQTYAPPPPPPVQQQYQQPWNPNPPQQNHNMYSHPSADYQVQNNVHVGQPGQPRYYGN